MGTPSGAAFDPAHPGWIYVDKSAGVTGNLYLTTDYGVTWTQKASPPATFSDILSLAVDPDQPATLIAATPGAFYKSSDGAASWTLQTTSPVREPSFFPETNLPFVLVPPSCGGAAGLFAAGDGVPGSYSVAYSPDMGITWNTAQAEMGSGVQRVEIAVKLEVLLADLVQPVSNVVALYVSN